MPFFGTYEHSIDSKGRIAIPSELRRQILFTSTADKEEAIRLYVVPYKREALSVYTESAYNQLAADLQDSDLSDEALEEYERMLFSLTRVSELDKAGRIRLPDDLREMIGLGGDAVLLGVGDHMEIRDRGAWNAKRQATLNAQPDFMVNPRRRRRRALE